MAKLEHKVRDAVHGFVRFSALEKELIDTREFQRLRHISQLALTSFVYPGATHGRFEHSLGVMDLSGRVFDVVWRSVSDDAEVREHLANELVDEDARRYWRQTLRAAALLHDLGHLPFSHAAEKQLMPSGWNHERMTAEIVRRSTISEVLNRHKPPICPEDVIKLAWDRTKRPPEEPGLTEWETILNEIITGDTFGVDRMDYLLRDSTHAGVTYGRFDPLRLIDSLTIVVDPGSDHCSLALHEGGIRGAEALLLARYFMYTQVYFHRVRRAYDKHLQRFLAQWLPGGRFPKNWQKFISLTDNEVWAGIYASCRRSSSPAHAEALRIVQRDHFRKVYSWNPAEDVRCPGLWAMLQEELPHQFGSDVITDRNAPEPDAASFPVRTENGPVENSLVMSDVLARIPQPAFGYVLADKTIVESVREVVEEKREALLNSNPGREAIEDE